MNINRLTEAELKEYAHKIASRVVFTNSEGGQWCRGSSAQEHEIIFNIAYGALNGLNYQGVVYESIASEAVLNAAEYTLSRFLPELSAYFTIWVPLMDFVGECTCEVIDPD